MSYKRRKKIEHVSPQNLADLAQYFHNCTDKLENSCFHPIFLFVCILKNSLLRYTFRFRRSFQTLGNFVALDEYCILVAFHKEGSAINMATTSSYFKEEMTKIHVLCFLSLTIYRTFQLKHNLQTVFFKWMFHVGLSIVKRDSF